MTEKEAIKHGKEQLEVFGGDHADFIKVAIKALEKQIPKKPIIRKSHTQFREIKVYSCPMCTNDFNSDGHTIDKFARKHILHHCKCGQAIDWSEEE